MNFFDEIDVKLLKEEPRHYRSRRLIVGTIVKCMMTPDGKLSLPYPNEEVPTCFRQNVKEGKDFDWIGEKPKLPNAYVPVGNGLWRKA